MLPVSAIAYVKGGIPADRGGVPLHGEALVLPGGMDYDADPRKCQEYKTDGTRCEAFSVGGGSLCIGHRNNAEKLAREAEADA